MNMISSAIQTIKSMISKSMISIGVDETVDLDGADQPKFSCPVCDHVMTLRDERHTDQFGLEDARVHALRCESCGMVADRIFHPSIGYDHNIVV